MLVGPSGSGKSTLLRLVNRLVDPTSGRVLVRDADVATLDPAPLRRSIGYVIQSIGLFPHRTVADNVATVPRLLGWPKEKIAARVAEMLDLVHLGGAAFANRAPAELSGGQAQRVGLARALAGDPDILLMDEPFGAVDPITRQDLRAELKRIHAETGKTILLVTHDPVEALELATQIVVLRRGRVVAAGSPLDLTEADGDAFVRDLFGGEALALRRLRFTRVGDVMTCRAGARPRRRSTLTRRSAKRWRAWSRRAHPALPLSAKTGAASVRSRSRRWWSATDESGAAAFGRHDARSSPHAQRSSPGRTSPASRSQASGIPGRKRLPPQRLISLAWSHSVIALLAVVPATVIGIGFGILVTRRAGRPLRPMADALVAASQAVPPVVVVALAFPALGFGAAPTVLALVIYCVMPILRGTAAALDSASGDVAEAARAMGMTPFQVAPAGRAAAGAARSSRAQCGSPRSSPLRRRPSARSPARRRSGRRSSSGCRTRTRSTSCKAPRRRARSPSSPTGSSSSTLRGLRRSDPPCRNGPPLRNNAAYRQGCDVPPLPIA